MPTMTLLSDLPVEIITHIMRFLSVSDRKELALVNKTWYEASLDPILQRDVVLNLQSMLNTRSLLCTERRTANLILDSLSEDESWIDSCKQIGKSLLSLSVRGCDITEKTFITFLSHCPCLTSLDLSGCNSPFMTGKLLEKESDQLLLKNSLSSLKELNLSSVRYLSNQTFNRLVCSMVNLEALDLSCCQILFHSTEQSTYTDGNLFTFKNVLTFLRDHSTLLTLSLSKTSVNNEALKSLASVPGLRLKSIDLSYCRDITESGLTELCEKQKQIERLNLTGCAEIGDSVVDAIVKNLSSIKDLNLKQCAFITDRGVTNLKALDSLRDLNLAGVHRPSQLGFTAGLASCLTNLVTLCLSGNSTVNDSVVLSICLNLHSLRSLDLSSCFYITDRGLVSIFYYLQNIHDLNLAHCKKITDLGLLGLRAEVDDHEHLDGACKCSRKYNSTQVFQLGIKLDDLPNITLQQTEELQNKVEGEVASLKNLKHLRSLNFQGVANISDISVTQVVCFEHLRSLNFNMCSRITDESVFSIANKNPCLEEFQIGSSAISDVGVCFLVQKLRCIRSLVISNCDQITDYTITALGNYCRRLRYLDVSFCSSVTETAMEYLEERLPNLSDVHKRYISTD